MELNSSNLSHENTNSAYNRNVEVKAFEESKVGVRGLVESGVTKIPRMFYSGELNIFDNSNNNTTLSVPIIDLKGIHVDPARRIEVISQIRTACKEWGFFQVINHEIPICVLDEMLDGFRRFHEQDSEVRRQFYNRDNKKNIVYFSNASLYQNKYVNWRDSFGCSMAPKPPKSEEFPEVLRDIIIEYSNKIMTLGNTIFELFSEALGLDSSYLKELKCLEALYVQGHYYPSCPEPELTMGASKHTDPGFMAIVLQDQLGGLQVLHENQWVNVSPVHGALVVNVGDLLQLITNDNFVSVFHRVLLSDKGPRVSVANFFGNLYDLDEASSKVYGPIKKLLSEEIPPIYRETSFEEFMAHYLKKGYDGSKALQPFRL